MNEIKPIQTEYNGYRFRSRLEARWAVFFDAMGIKYEYEPEGFVLPSGKQYLPDFKVKCWGKRGEIGDEPFDLYIEVKGDMNEHDENKIKEFAGSPFDENGLCNEQLKDKMHPVLVVGPITSDLPGEWYMCKDIFYNYSTIDGDEFGAFPCASDGKMFLWGADSSYIWNSEKVEHALDIARKARFEFGETPVVPHGR